MWTLNACWRVCQAGRKGWAAQRLSDNMLGEASFSEIYYPTFLKTCYFSNTDMVHIHMVCRTMIEVKPNFHMFSEEEVLENLVINQVINRIETQMCKLTNISMQARKSVEASDLDSLAKVAGRFLTCVTGCGIL